MDILNDLKKVNKIEIKKRNNNEYLILIDDIDSEDSNILYYLFLDKKTFVEYHNNDAIKTILDNYKFTVQKDKIKIIREKTPWTPACQPKQKTIYKEFLIEPKYIKFAPFIFEENKELKVSIYSWNDQFGEDYCEDISLKEAFNYLTIEEVNRYWGDYYVGSENNNL